MKRLAYVFLALPLVAFAAEHGGKPAAAKDETTAPAAVEHTKMPAESKEHAAEHAGAPAESKEHAAEHADKPAESKTEAAAEHGGKPAEEKH